MLVNINCPVELLDYKLYESKNTGKIYCSLTFNNLSSKKVKGLKNTIYCYDQFGDPVGGIDNEFECKIEFKEGLPQNCKRTIDNKITLAGFQNTRKIEVDIVKVLFDDNSMWTKGTSETETVDLKKIENIKLMEFAQDRIGEDAKYFAKKVEKKWICICGRLNHDYKPTCIRCGREQEYILTNYSDEETIICNLKAFELEIAKKQMETQKELEQQLESKKNKKRTFTKYSSYLALILLLGGFVFFSFLTKFTFTFKDNHQLQEENNKEELSDTVVNKDEEAGVASDGIINTSFVASGGSNGRGEIKINYRKNGSIKNKVISDIIEPRIIDVDNNGVKELVFTNIIYVPELSNSQMPYWDDVYNFDLNKEDLVFASSEYQEYYKDIYIPSLEKKISESNSSREEQVLNVLKQAATNLINGNFIPDANQRGITSLIKTNEPTDPLHISKKDNYFYIHGITLGMNIKEAIKILGEPDDSFEVNSKVMVWRLENNLELTVEYYVDTIHYIDLGIFDESTLELSMSVLGEPSEEGKDEHSYTTPLQILRFHNMVESGTFRVQLMDPESP